MLKSERKEEHYQSESGNKERDLRLRHLAPEPTNRRIEDEKNGGAHDGADAQHNERSGKVAPFRVVRHIKPFERSRVATE